MIYDDFGRPLLNLRISVTQRCNLNCPYCHREGESNSTTTAGEMKVEEIIRITEIAIRLEISNIKLTGGEPLLRNDITKIVEGIANILGINDLSMTTNGVRLSLFAKELKHEGLMRVNISLPSLNFKTYKKLMHGNLQDVLKGINSAVNRDIASGGGVDVFTITDKGVIKVLTKKIETKLEV